MHQFWNVLIRPLLELIAPSKIVEVGASYGQNTANLLEYAAANGVMLHVIDPCPRFDEADWVTEPHDNLVVHRELSLKVLPNIDRFEAILIDGDHNWYTVYNELLCIESSVLEAGAHFPTVFFHDIDWPYGRRDLYYFPDTIPEEYRRELTRKGLIPGQNEPASRYGIGGGLWKSTDENGIRNGVRTAIEDFLRRTKLSLKFTCLPGIHGLGIIVDSRLFNESREIAVFLDSLRMGSFESAYIEAIENDRINIMAALARAKTKYRELEDYFAARFDSQAQSIVGLEKRLGIKEDMVAGLLEAETSLLKEISVLQADIAESKKDQDRLRSDREVLEKQLRDEAEAVGTRLRTINKRLVMRTADVETLTQWVDEIEVNFESLVTSSRWRFGNVIGNLVRRLTLRPPVATNAEEISALLAQYRRWKRKFESLGSQRRLPVQDEINVERHAPAKTAVRGSFQMQVRGCHIGDIVVCIHNAPEDTRRCLESIARHTNLNRHHLILVDDGSDHETACLVVEYASRFSATLIRNETARAYTCAANQGLSRASGDFVILLNSDAIVTAGWIERLSECAFSNADIACVGPLSNAASWQSIPKLTDSDGRWLVNDLPDRIQLSDFSEIVATGSHNLYPSVSFVNGFCFLMTRQAIEKIGALDETNFPRGFGEEDDFCIRALDAGMTHRIADNCYVFHTKSKSYTPHGRQAIVAKSKDALQKKHTGTRITTLIDGMKINEELLRARLIADSSVQAALGGPESRDLFGTKLTIGWLQPHLGTAGGIRRAIEMTNRLTSWGASVYLITGDGKRTTWMPIASIVTTFELARTVPFDVIIVSDPDVIEPYLELGARLRINYHLAPYMKYREAGRLLDLYYGSTERDLNIANSVWTKTQVEEFCGIEILKVIPGGINQSIFHPVRADVRYDVACMGSHRIHKGTSAIEAASKGLRLLKLAEADLSQRELAANICSSRVFASACWHEGFSFCPLEAMACGVPVAMTDDGGSREYAVNEENALVVDVGDQQGLTGAIHRLLNEPSLRIKLIENGMATARKFNWDRMTCDLVDLITDHLQ